MSNILLVDEALRGTIGSLLDVAHDDQTHWLDYGSPEIDYGDDPDAVQLKLVTYRDYADLARRVGLHGEAERWEELCAKLSAVFEGSK